MPTINLDGLKREQVEDTYLYRDIQLDISDNNIQPDVGLFRPTTTTDIALSTDEAAIKNSLINIFSTMPGQKLLNPDFGLNLAQFLFQPVSPTMAFMIGNRILEGLQRYEPRVTVDNVNVFPDEEQSSYEIDLTLKIPKLSNSSMSFAGILKQPGFSSL